MSGRLILPDSLGTDTRERGAWRKTNCANWVAMALHDCAALHDMTGPELFGALTENLIAAVQGGIAPSDWQRAGDSVTSEIMRRLTRR